MNRQSPWVSTRGSAPTARARGLARRRTQLVILVYTTHAQLRRLAAWDQRRRQEPDQDARAEGVLRGKRLRGRRHLYPERQRAVRLTRDTGGGAHSADRGDARRDVRLPGDRGGAQPQTDARRRRACARGL